MTLEADIFTALRGIVDDRVYPIVLPQNPVVPITPAIRYQFVSFAPDLDVCGSGADATAETRTQVDVFSTSYTTARSLRQQVITAMTGMDIPTALEGGFDDYESELKLYRCSMDFISRPSS